MAFFNLSIFLWYGVKTITASSAATRWMGLYFAFAFLESVCGIPIATMGYEEYTDLLDQPETVKYLVLVLVSMISFGCGVLTITRVDLSRHWIFNLPEIASGGERASNLVRTISAAGAVTVILMSITGYYGYFNTVNVAQIMPWWLDLVKIATQIAASLMFIVVYVEFQYQSRLSLHTISVILLWSIAGILTGFKSMVFAGPLAVVTAALIQGRVRLTHILSLCVAIYIAYYTIEPMRLIKDVEVNANPLSTAVEVVSSSTRHQFETPVIEQIFKRVDFTRVGIQILILDTAGGAIETRARLEESYLLFPLIAVIPRFLWESKPLQDLGAVLNYELYGFEGNSITPGHVVSSYLWLGISGVVLNSFAAGVYVGLAGRLVSRYSRRMIENLPIFIFAILISPTYGLFFVKYIELIRFTIALFACYLLLNFAGLLRTRAETTAATANGMTAQRAAN